MSIEPKDGDFQSMIEKMVDKSLVNNHGYRCEQIKNQKAEAKDCAKDNTQAKASAKIKPKDSAAPQDKGIWTRFKRIMGNIIFVLFLILLLMIWGGFKELLNLGFSLFLTGTGSTIIVVAVFLVFIVICLMAALIGLKRHEQAERDKLKK